MLTKISVEGNIVKDVHVGNTHILVSDAAYANQAPEEIRQAEKEFNQKGLNIYLRHLSGRSE